MIRYHDLQMSDFDFGDNIKTIVCYECGRSISVEADENGVILWKTMKITRQGDFFALHKFATEDGVDLRASMAL